MADALPVDCLLGEDLVESSAVFSPQVVMPGGPLVTRLPGSRFHTIFGDNDLLAKR